MSEDPRTIVDYDRPPVVETVLGVQFHPLRGFKNSHLGAIWRRLGFEAWPTIEIVPGTPPQIESFDTHGLWGLTFGVELSPPQRLRIWNADKSLMLQVQRDQFYVNWIGAQPDGTLQTYPKYPNTRRVFQESLLDFGRFLKDEGIESLAPIQWEVTYVNEIPKGEVWSSPDDWNFFSPISSYRPPNSFLEDFEGNWVFSVPQNKARLRISWERFYGPNDRETLRIVFTARGPLPESKSDSAIIDGLDLGRSTIVQAFQSMMSAEAQDVWQRRSQ